MLMQEDIRKYLEVAERRLRFTPSTAIQTIRPRRAKLYSLVSLGAAVLVVAIVAVTGTVLRHPSSAASPIPMAYTSGLDFPLFYPTKLPAGYRVDKTSFQRKDGVLIFNIVAPNGKDLAVSEEASPSNAPVRNTSNSPSNIAGERAFDVAAGHAHIGLWGDKYVADILADQTWIIINGTGFSADQLTPVTQSFHKL